MALHENEQRSAEVDALIACPRCGWSEALTRAINAERAKAWSEGYRAGRADVAEVDDRWTHFPATNPYGVISSASTAGVDF